MFADFDIPIKIALQKIGGQTLYTSLDLKKLQKASKCFSSKTPVIKFEGILGKDFSEKKRN